MDRRISLVDEVEHGIESLLRALDRGHRPNREVVEAVQSEFGRLPRTDGSIPGWRLAALDAAMQDLVRRGTPSSSASTFVPAPRDSQERPQPAPPASHIERSFDALRRRVDALHDLVEIGRKPTNKTFDDLHADLVAHGRRADGAEIRQMIADVRGFRRATLAAARPTTPPRLASSRAGRGFWGMPMSEGRQPRRRKRSSPRRRSRESTTPSTGEFSAERTRLADESRRLRDRAARFAAAVPRGRTLPLRESDRLFLQFKLLRPDVDAETRALNDSAVRVLAEAVIAVRRRSATA